MSRMVFSVLSMIWLLAFIVLGGCEDHVSLGESERTCESFCAAYGSRVARYQPHFQFTIYTQQYCGKSCFISIPHLITTTRCECFEVNQ